MIWHSSSVSDIEQKMGTSAERGLTAQQVEEKLAKYGRNIVTGKKKKSFMARFFAQLKDTMVIILMIAAVVSAIVTAVSGENDWIEPIIIIAIVVFNALLGVIQESRAENALEALKSMAAPMAKVVRDGEQQTIDATGLVPGDVIVFEAGDYVPADARLVEAYSLHSDESMLTGESVPAEKEAGIICEDIAPIGDRQNMIFSGCSISYGHGRAIVTETGAYTEMGKIATMLTDTESAVTPLQIKLAKLGKSLGIIALVICAVIFVVGKLMNLGWLEMFMTSVSLAVAAIPEGLPAIVTIVLAMGVQRMVKKNAIIRRLPAVETLGSASVICSDKTGTLTQNRMTLTAAYANHKMYDMTACEMNDELLTLLRLGALCCDGDAINEGGSWKYIGDPTETAIVRATVEALGTDKQTLDMSYPRMAELPFDSDRKLMTVVCVIDGKPFSITKGGFDIILDRCKNVDKEEIEKANLAMAKNALRVLGIAIKPLSEVPSNPNCDDLEHDLTFMGLVGLIDPPRPEAKKAIGECYSAGIRTIMITGDHVVTAAAIARQLGIMKEDDIALTGVELDAMSDDELSEKLEHICVYARVSPENKIRIVQAWQAKGEIVAMTGDGVNDAPALKAADIGCAMGVTGTDVAKGAAAMTLTDDNFATIVTAVKQGRGIFENIRKAVHFLLSCNLGEIIAVFFGLLFFKSAPLTPILLLWLNLVTDSFPALALGVEPIDRDIMKNSPRDKNESVFARGLGINSLWQGIMFGVLTLAAYFIGLKESGGQVIYAQSMAFATLSISQLVHAFNCRSDKSIFKAGVFRNPQMWLAFCGSLALVLCVQLIPPLRSAFGLAALNATEFLEIGLLSIVPLVLTEIVKLITWLIKAIMPEKQPKPKAAAQRHPAAHAVRADEAPVADEKEAAEQDSAAENAAEDTAEHGSDSDSGEAASDNAAVADESANDIEKAAEPAVSEPTEPVAEESADAETDVVDENAPEISEDSSESDSTVDEEPSDADIADDEGDSDISDESESVADTADSADDADAADENELPAEESESDSDDAVDDNEYSSNESKIHYIATQYADQIQEIIGADADDEDEDVSSAERAVMESISKFIDDGDNEDDQKDN
ncbi:MAG: HAD-IC family P-type ATPase [Acutalibacteraceae bacterium]